MPKHVCIDPALGPYYAFPPRGRFSREPLMLDDFHVKQATQEVLSRTVSAIWDCDLKVDHVLLSRTAALQLPRLPGDDFSLEALVWEGWEYPVVWFRAGTDETPHGFAGGVPMPCRLHTFDDPSFAWLVKNTSAEPPPYIRALWAGGAPVTGASEEEHLQRLQLAAIIADHARQTA